MSENVQSCRDLLVWQRAMELVRETYLLTEQFPKEEMFGLTSQMRRASVSIPSNIAEGSRRGSKKDFRHFLLLAFGSGSELETQCEIARTLPFSANLNFQTITRLLDEVMKMLNSLIRSLGVSE